MTSSGDHFDDFDDHTRLKHAILYTGIHQYRGDREAEIVARQASLMRRRLVMEN